jgi:hypothetical protein
MRTYLLSFAVLVILFLESTANADKLNDNQEKTPKTLSEAIGLFGKSIQTLPSIVGHAYIFENGFHVIANQKGSVSVIFTPSTERTQLSPLDELALPADSAVDGILHEQYRQGWVRGWGAGIVTDSGIIHLNLPLSTNFFFSPHLRPEYGNVGLMRTLDDTLWADATQPRRSNEWCIEFARQHGLTIFPVDSTTGTLACYDIPGRLET